MIKRARITAEQIKEAWDMRKWDAMTIQEISKNLGFDRFQLIAAMRGNQKNEGDDSEITT